MTPEDNRDHAALLSRSAELRAWSEDLLMRSRQACEAATQTRETFPLPASLAPVAVTELFTILVDHHDLTVLEAVKGLATHLAGAGYPEDVDVVSAADAVDITHAILTEW